MFVSKNKRHPLTLLLILIMGLTVSVSSVLFFKIHKVWAATRTWDGGGTDGTCGGNAGDGNKWSCAANWSSDIVPTSVDNVIFDGTSTKNATIDASFTGTITSLTISAGYSGTITQARSLTVTGGTGFSQSAGTFNSGSQSLSVSRSAGNAFVLSGGTFTASSGTFIIDGGISITGGTFNHNSGTISLTTSTGGGTLTLACGNKTFNRFVFNNTLDVTVNSDCSLPLGNNPTIPANGISDLYGILSGTGTLTLASGGFIDMETGSSLSGFSGLVNEGSLTLNGGTLNLGSYTTADFNDQFTINSGTFTAPSGNMTVSSTFSIQETATFNHNSGTITFDGTSQYFHCEQQTLNKVVLSHTGTFTADGSFVAAEQCTIPLGNNPTVVGVVTSDLPFSGTGTLTAQSNFKTWWQTFGGGISGFDTINIQGNFSATDGVVDVDNVNVTGDFEIVALDAVPAFTTITVGGTATINHEINLLNATTVDFNDLVFAGTFVAPSGVMTVSGDFTKNGNFTHSSGTVVLDGTNQTLSGFTNFYNLTKNVSSADTLTFTAGSSQSIFGTLNLSGTAGNLLSLRSSSDGSEWEIDPKGTRTISYLDVKDSNNTNFFHINVIGFNITDSGNNTNWNFAGDPDPENLEFYTVNPFDDEITLYNGNTGQALSSATLTYPGKTITGAQGLAYHPQTCSLYGLLTFSGQSGRQLVTINPDTGVATNVGNTGKKFAGITFDNNGTLYAVTGDGETNLPETLYTLNTSTGAPTQFLSLGNGDSGETIAFNTDDGYLYHLSGNVFEKINLSTLTVTDIPLNLSEFDGETTGMMYVADRDYFYISHYADVATLSLTGTEIDLATFSTDIKGMARNDCVPQAAPSTSSLGPTSLVNGSSDSDTTPTFNFTLSDVNTADTVQYHLQIDDTADFSSPVVDYTSALAAQGSTSFTVGQAAGSGSYATGANGQTLSDGSYYWRVRGTDNYSNTGSYTTANSGSIAFVISSVSPNTAPNMPSSLGPSDLINGGVVNNNHPSFSFVLSDSNVSDTIQYRIQIDDSSDFSSLVVDYTSGLTAQGLHTFMVGQDSGTGTYAVGGSGQSLSNGSYYWRVQAIDVNTVDSAFSHARPGEVAFIINYAAPSSSPSSSTSNGSGVCTASAPATAPTLYSATPVNAQSIELSFSRVSGDYTHYDLEYGTSPDSYQYGATNIGGADIRKYTVSALNPTTRYYFRVRAVNTCTSGGWSNEASALISAASSSNTSGSTLDTAGNLSTSSGSTTGVGGGSGETPPDRKEVSATEPIGQPSETSTEPQTELAKIMNGVPTPQILGSFTEIVVQFREDTIAGIATLIPWTRAVLESNTLETVANALPALTLAVPILAAAATSVVSNSVLSPLVSAIIRFLQFIGLVPKRKPQGIVFDTKTGVAIPFVSIVITRKGDTKIVDQVVTDEFGVYQSVQLAEGTYTIEATHSQYIFPTSKPRSAFTSMADFFKGEEIIVSRQHQDQFVLIPMDPKSDLYIPTTPKKTPSVWLQVLSRYLQLLFVPLALLSAILTFFFPSTFNLFILSLYVLLFAVDKATLLRRPWISGKVRSEVSKPLKGVVVRCIETSTNRLIATRLTDSKGAFSFRAKPEKYTLIFTKDGYSLVGGTQIGSNLHLTHSSKTKSLDVKMSAVDTTFDPSFFDAPVTQPLSPSVMISS